MRAAVFEQFQHPLSIQQVPDPTPDPDGVVLKVMATGSVPLRLARLDGARLRYSPAARARA